VPLHDVNRFFTHTVVVNQIVQGNNHRIVNKGIPVNHIAAATRSNIPAIRLRDSEDPGILSAGRINRDGTLAVFHPNFPAPDRWTQLVGEGIRANPYTYAFPHQIKMPMTGTARPADWGTANPGAPGVPVMTSPVYRSPRNVSIGNYPRQSQVEMPVLQPPQQHLNYSPNLSRPAPSFSRAGNNGPAAYGSRPNGSLQNNH
jgi:hypothetical protein